jgi:hypothetical protein
MLWLIDQVTADTDWLNVKVKPGALDADKASKA